MRQQIAADHFTGAQRQNFIGIQPDIDRLDGAPEGWTSDRPQQNIPAPAVAQIYGEVEDYRDGHISQVERLEIR